MGTMAVAIVPIAGLFVPLKFHPFLTLVLSLLLFSFVKSNRVSKAEVCAVVPYIAARTLFCFTVLSIIVGLFRIGMKSNNAGVFWAEEMQVHSILSLSALFVFVTFLMKKRRWNNTICADCLLRNGTPQEREMLGHIYVSETGYLFARLMKLFGLLFFLSVISLVLHHVNTYSSVFLNVVYVGIPLLVVVSDIILCRSRYFVIGRIQAEKSKTKYPFGGEFKLIRILLIAQDGLYLVERNGEKDTPFEFYEGFSEQMSLSSVNRYMENTLGFPFPENGIRFCYGTIDVTNKRSIEHYLCFTDNRMDTECFEKKNMMSGKWFGKQDLEMKFGHGFSKIACSEFHRIYVVMQTNRMYFPNGQKKVGIKGYAPSFSLSDLKNTDVDFSDNRWMLLSKFNKDDSFYFLKKAWHQYIEGLN